MWRDIRFSLRTLRRNPVFTVAAVLTMALGMGATTAIFSLFDQVVLRFLPVREPQRLVLLHREYQPEGNSTSDNMESVFSYPMYRELRDHDPAFQGVVARGGFRVAVFHGGGTEPAAAEVVSGNFFQSLGVPAEAGRVFNPQDDGAAGAHPVIVLGHGYWSTRFGGDRAIVGQSITVNRVPMVVVGVAAAGFQGLRPGSTPDLYVPIAMQKAVRPTWDVLEDPLFRWLNVFARLKPGFGLQQAQAATDVTYHSILESEVVHLPADATAADRNKYLHHTVELRAASQGISGLRRQWEKPLMAVLAMVGLVLLIACANVAGLLLARSAGRQREIAIRLALGATRKVLTGQLLIEGLILSLVSAALGLAIAHWTSGALVRVLPRGVGGGWLSASIDVRMLGFSVALAVGCGLLFGLVPALQTHSSIGRSLKSQAAQISSGGQARLRKAMVAGQVAFSLMLLVGAGLFAESLFRLMSVDLGFHSERLLTFTVDATVSRPQVAAALEFYRDLQDRTASIPGVVGVAASDSGPFAGSDRAGNITVEGYRARENEYVGAQRTDVSAGFFRALGIPLGAGRELEDRDRAGAPKTAVVNEAFVKRYFGSANPLGRHLMFGASNDRVPDIEIVGVVTDSHKDIRKAPVETIYVPYAQATQPDRLMYYVRTTGNETRIAPDVRRLVRLLDPKVPMGDPQPMTVLVRNSVYADRLTAILSIAFGVLATVLAAIGLYGVVAYTVTRRTGEIGLRMALGALPADILRLILREAGRVVAGGLLIGLAGALALGRLVQAQLFGIRAADPALFAAAAALLALVALAAALLPAWRASRVDPLSALKYE
jgi:predicted permease